MLLNLGRAFVTIWIVLIVHIHAAKAQDMIEQAWYAVVYVPASDMLHWITSTGEITAIPRPHLPEEVNDAKPLLRLSTDGNYLLIVTQFEDAMDGLGIYALSQDELVGVYKAEHDEKVFLAPKHNTDSESQHVALSIRNETTESWRYIILDLASVQPIRILTSEDFRPTSGSLNSPKTIYFDQNVVHFQIPAPVSVRSQESYAWNYMTGELTTSPYYLDDLDILTSTGEVAFTFDNIKYAAVSFDHPNAIGWFSPGEIDLANPVTSFVREEAGNDNARWAAGGKWIVFRSWGGEIETIEWTVIPVAGSPDAKPFHRLPENVLDIFGTPDGYLMITNQNEIHHAADIDDTTGNLIFKPAVEGWVQVIFVSPENSPPDRAVG
jgi:hypothetical protein